MKPPCTKAEFRFICDTMRAACPPEPGTRLVFRRVKREKLNGDHAATVKVARTFCVLIANDLTELETQDAVIHECAHARSWRPANDRDHDATWGVNYAEVYRRYKGTL